MAAILVVRFDALPRRDRLSRSTFRSILPFLLFAQPAFAGANAGVEIEVSPLSPPCQQEGGDTIEFLVTARGMQDVRQIKLDLRWQPQGAIDSVRVELPESAQSAGLIAPFPAEVEPGAAALGLATFGDGVSGEADLIRFTLLLASHVTAQTRMDVWIDEVSMGPSSTERDNLNPLGTELLANYCDDRHQILEHALLLDPDIQNLPYSSPQRSPILDQSAGEAEVLVRLLDGGSLVPGTMMRWAIVNSGVSQVNILEGIVNEPVPPGFGRSYTTTADHRGRSALVFDVGAPTSGEPTTVEIFVCAESSEGERCAVGRIEWTTRVTAIAATDAVNSNILLLEPSYPNPFNGQTQIRFHVPENANDKITLGVFNSVGQRVRLLVDGPLSPGVTEKSWNGRDQSGKEMASGVYFAVLRAGLSVRSASFTLLR